MLASTQTGLSVVSFYWFGIQWENGILTEQRARELWLVKASVPPELRGNNSRVHRIHCDSCACCTQHCLKIHTAHIRVHWPITNKNTGHTLSHTCPHIQQPVDLPCNRLASSLVNRTLASLLWQYACLVSNFFFSQFKSSKSSFPTMWAREARLITLLGADSFNLSSRRFVSKKWPGGRQTQNQLVTDSQSSLWFLEVSVYLSDSLQTACQSRPLSSTVDTSWPRHCLSVCPHAAPLQ